MPSKNIINSQDTTALLALARQKQWGQILSFLKQMKKQQLHQDIYFTYDLALILSKQGKKEYQTDEYQKILGWVKENCHVLKHSTHWLKAYSLNKQKDLSKSLSVSVKVKVTVVDYDNIPETPLVIALSHGNFYLADILLPMIDDLPVNGCACYMTFFARYNYMNGMNYYYNLGLKVAWIQPKALALQHSIRYNHRAIFDLLLKRESYRGVSYSMFFKDYPVAWAIRYNRFDMMKTLVEKNVRQSLFYDIGGNLDIHPVVEAAKLGKMKYFTWLVNFYARKNSRKLLPKSHNKEVNKLFEYTATILSEINELPALQFLVEKGVDIHYSGELMFTYACSRNAPATRDYLYSLGVDIHADHDKPYSWSIGLCLEGIKWLEARGVDYYSNEEEWLTHALLSAEEDEYQTLDYFMNKSSTTLIRSLLLKYSVVVKPYIYPISAETNAYVMNYLLERDMAVYERAKKTVQKI